MLLAGAEVLVRNRDKIPGGKVIRLLFQPAEEGPGGALPMIKEGCLEGVEEVYGCHNNPMGDEGDIHSVPGPVLAASTQIKIVVKGQGGHGSTPDKAIDPITCASQSMQGLHTIKSRNVDSRKECVLSITHFESGHAVNVMPDTALMQGTLRTFNHDIKKLVKDRITDICNYTAKAFGCEVELMLKDKYPATINTPKEHGHIERVTKKWFGAEHFSDGGLPG
jgi:hippurate hydrolase